MFAIAAGYEDADDCNFLSQSDLQDGGGPAAENGRAFVLAADDVAAGECPLEDRGRAGDGGHG